MNQQSRNAANFIKAYRPKWPKPVRLIGRGSYGSVFNTNNGRVMKIAEGNNTRSEFNMLKALQGAYFIPRVKNGNYMKLVNSNNLEIFSSKYHYNPSRNGGAFIMGKVGGNKGMTLKKYLENYPKFSNRAYNRLKSIIEYLQVRGFVHGDIHGGNVIVTAGPDGRITGMWLVDLGSTRKIGQRNNNNNFYHLQRLFDKKRNESKNMAEKYDIRRRSIARNLELLGSSPRNRLGRARSVRASPKKAPQRARSAPARVNKTKIPFSLKRALTYQQKKE